MRSPLLNICFIWFGWDVRGSYSLKPVKVTRRTEEEIKKQKYYDRKSHKLTQIRT